MRKEHSKVFKQELLVYANRLNLDCDQDEYIKHVMKLIRLARAEGKAIQMRIDDKYYGN